MDEDRLFLLLENMEDELSHIRSEISRVIQWIPDETDISAIELKLDRIIELIEELVSQQQDQD